MTKSGLSGKARRISDRLCARLFSIVNFLFAGKVQGERWRFQLLDGQHVGVIHELPLPPGPQKPGTRACAIRRSVISQAG